MSRRKIVNSKKQRFIFILVFLQSCR